MIVLFDTIEMLCDAPPLPSPHMNVTNNTSLFPCIPRAPLSIRTGHLFCYVAKVQDGTRWCRVFRCEDAMLLREAAAGVVKDALMIVRYNEKMCAVHPDARAAEQVYARQMREAARQHEADHLVGDIDKMRSRLEAPFLFTECGRYHRPPPYRHNPEEVYDDDEDDDAADKLPRCVWVCVGCGCGCV